MITVSFASESVHKLREVMREFLGLDVEPAPKKEPSKSQAKPAAPSTEIQGSLGEATASNIPKLSDVVTYKDIADYIPKAVSKYGRGKIVTLLEGFGAKTGKDLKSEQYAEVMTKLKAEYPL
jgi:hypothetical protein